jgi:hypothetical protein
MFMNINDDISCTVPRSVLEFEVFTAEYGPPKRRLQLNRLHGVTSQKIILFKCIRVQESKNLSTFPLAFYEI